MSRLKIVSGLPYTIVIESWNTHASSSSQEVLLWKDAVRGLKEKRERSQSVPLTLPASYSLTLPVSYSPESLHFSETFSLGIQILRVPTPFDTLNRASHSPALVHPEALHFSETFSLGIQILRVPTPL